MRPLCLDCAVFDARRTDPEACLRLTICHRNGTICVFTFHHSLDTWVVAGPPLFAKHESLEHPLLARMLSPRGDILEATVNALEGAIRGFTPSHQNLPDLPPSFLLLVSARAAAIKGSLTESSLAKVDFSEAIAAAEVVTRHESAFLAVCTAAGAVSLFTLPQLQPFNRIPFTSPTSSDQHTSLSASIATDGDYILLDGHQAHFRTLFARNRGRFPPSLTLHDPALHGPARPTMPKLSTTGQAAGGMLSGFSSWLTRPAAMTGDAFDALIAGPNRPAKKEPPKSVAAPARARSASASKYRQDAPLANRNLLEAKNASGSAHASARETNEMLEEREDRLAQLNEGLSNLATGARDALNEARKTALQQGLKSKFNSLF